MFVRAAVDAVDFVGFVGAVLELVIEPALEAFGFVRGAVEDYVAKPLAFEALEWLRVRLREEVGPV